MISASHLGSPSYLTFLPTGNHCYFWCGLTDLMQVPTDMNVQGIIFLKTYCKNSEIKARIYKLWCF